MVAGGHCHHGVGILAQELISGVGDAGGRVALERLQQDIFGGNADCLRADQ